MSDVFAAPGSLAPVFGDANDGTVTHSSDTTLTGITVADTWTVESGVTVELDGAMIFASERIVIEGTVHSDAPNGSAGGSGGGALGSGAAGTDGQFVTGGAGGDGGDGDGNAGDGGAGGGTTFSNREAKALRVAYSGSWDTAFDGTFFGAAGGGGGGGGDEFGTDATGGSGGDGGDGAGWMALIAPTIVLQGTIRAQGQDGNDGGDGQCSGDAAEGGGGGGGGGGGELLTVTDELLNSGTIDLSEGAGGAGGSGCSGGSDGQPGSDGETGVWVDIRNP